MKRFYAICFCVALFVSCVQEQNETDYTSDIILFEADSVSDTRGAIIQGSQGRNPLLSMSVFCAYTDKNKYDVSVSQTGWMHNVRVSRRVSGDPWIVNDPLQPDAKYKWAGDGYHTFFAYAPYQKDGFSAVTQAGPPQLTYVVPTDHKQQTDLLFSHKTLLDGKQMYIGSRPVNFGFSHALSKITFSARKEPGMIADVLITDISIANLKNSGTLKLIPTGLYPFMFVAQWSAGNSVASLYQVSVANSGLKKLTLNDLDYLPLQSADSALFLLPQKLNAENQLTINYLLKEGNVVTNKTMKADLSAVSGITQWETGKAYRYSVFIKDEKVVISGVIDNWKDNPVDGNPKATYLSLSESDMVIPKGKARVIWYATDGLNVVVSCPLISNLVYDKNLKTITIPQTVPAGRYVIDVKADKLTRKINLTVK
ncbi:MAG: fimbrillin family protein [Bacteroidales bacterium]